MLTQPLQTIRRTTAVTILSLVVVLASFGAPAGANTGKHPRKHPQKRALGALLPKRQVDAVTPVGANAVALPPSVDLSSDDVPVGNQTKEVGSCVTWAIDYAMLGWYARHDGRADELFNPMYTYSQIHLSATDRDGGGSKPEAAMAVAKAQGNDTIAHYHTHSTTDFASKPNASDLANAARFKIADWQTLFSNKDGSGGGSAGDAMIETALAGGKPVAITMNTRPGFVMYDRTDWASATD